MSRVYDALRRIRRDIKSSSGAPDASSAYASGYQNGTGVPLDPSDSRENGNHHGAATSAKVAKEAAPFLLNCRDLRITWAPTSPVLPNSATRAVLEQYKRLRTKILQLRDSNPINSLLITSPGPREGKTLTVVNLTLTFSMLPSFRVLAIDADLRRRSLTNMLGLQDAPGFANVLEGSCSLNDALVHCSESGAYFLPAGKSDTLAAELLHSPQVAIQLAHLTSAFELVLIDSPPANVITDTELLSAHCDAALLVARMLGTTCHAFEQMVETMRGRRVIGAVLNGTAPMARYHSYQSYYE